MTERVPGGLGDVRRPLVSGADDDTAAAMETSTTTSAAVEKPSVAEASAAVKPERMAEVEPERMAEVEPDGAAKDSWNPKATNEPMPVIDREEGSSGKLTFGDSAG
jgi:hypothetical protein